MTTFGGNYSQIRAKWTHLALAPLDCCQLATGKCKANWAVLGSGYFMGKILFFPVFLALTFGPPLYWGHIHASIIAPVLWALSSAAFAVFTGWRHANSGRIKSWVVGMALGLVGFVPIYLLGYWLS